MNEQDAFRDQCAVVGVYGTKDAANLTYLSLYALQHRGQESAGIVAGNGEDLYRRIGAGLVADVFNEEKLQALTGKIAIGHVRYSTSGDAGATLRDAQPLFVHCQAGPLAVAHNGNLVNDGEIRKQLENDGSIFQTSSDTEVFCHLVAKGRGTLLQRLIDSFERVRGAYSLIVTGDGKLYGARDPHGVRPLCLGKLREGWALASETCAFDLIDAEFVREIEPGEIVMIDDDGVHSHRFEDVGSVESAHCIFEHVYFARPDSLVFGRHVHKSRLALGRVLAQESPIDADVVIPVPDSGVYAAMGYADATGVPFSMGLVRNHYVGRTFIEPEQRIRNFGVRLKLNPVREILEGKRVVVIDDSIVRGTTSKKIVTMLRNAGAKEVHVRISAPPSTDPCFYGVDTPTKTELIASGRSTEEICEYIGADSLAYLSVAGLREAVVGKEDCGFCDACFTGNYPIAITRHKRIKTS